MKSNCNDSKQESAVAAQASSKHLSARMGRQTENERYGDAEKERESDKQSET